MAFQKDGTDRTDLGTPTAVHTFFIYRCGFQGHLKVEFIRLRQATGPDLQSSGRADASADGAEVAFAFLLFDEVLSISP